ncbi:MAG: bifunctional [glutamine synthetase] adenylyltransferase/[glutamine synthetase]-adenylyl-L-tyrosine phosphorylase [Magnetospirillum sp. WYHS-4]
MDLFGHPVDLAGLPRPAEREAARIGIERWLEAAREDGDAGLADRAAATIANPRLRKLLEGVFGNSPYLTFCAERDPGSLLRVLGEGPDKVVGEVSGELDGLRRRAIEEAELSAALRRAKRRIALAVAFADIAGLWGLKRVTEALSDFAAQAASCAAAHALRVQAARGAFTLRHPDDPERDSGYILIGMGKLGARELNYSSDIDLIVLFDPEKVATDDPDALQGHFVRVTKTLVRLLDDRTEEGYVFRTDLRLRPDPGSTPIAISVLAAELYYESVGQNWERLAMIKARPVAGDLEAGQAFVAGLKPFVWRRSLDFATIQDVHAVKRQINAHKGGASIAVAGHNIKLGRGGIREIEFFAQTQQLIFGGREPRLRQTGTEKALMALAAEGRTSHEAAGEMISAYHYLRRLEHRLQMINDEQTQTLPETDEGLDRLAAFMGYDDRRALAQDLVGHLRKVEQRYAELFEDSPALSGMDDIPGNLVFTGSDPDPDTYRTLETMGYRHPAVVDATVRGWHHARYRATSTRKACEILTEFMPRLLKALAATPDADAAFLKFDEFLSRLPAGVQLFSMIRVNPHLLDLLAEIMGAAPKLAEHLAHRPQVLESVLAPGFFEPPPPVETLLEEMDRVLSQAISFEDLLDLARRWVADRKFQIGVQSLKGLIAPRAAALALSTVAEAALARLYPHVEGDFAKIHGRFPGRGMAILAMGKLGGREMTPASDLDLIFVYDTGGAEASDGLRPIAPSQYFARLSQRFINAITAQTAEGALYEVDMRLRPSGKAGPIAVSLEAFAKYQREEAWTWEHMALTRARAISAPPELGDAVKAIIREVLTRPREADRLLRDVADMRRRMDAEHHTDFIWEVKHLRGGLVDIEFLTQYLQLRHGQVQPEALSQNTHLALERLRDAGCLAPALAGTLLEALDLWQALQGLLRLTIPGYFVQGREKDVPEALRGMLARLGDCPDFGALENRIRQTSAKVHDIFKEMIENPAASLPPPKEDHSP